MYRRILAKKFYIDKSYKYKTTIVNIVENILTKGTFKNVIASMFERVAYFVKLYVLGMCPHFKDQK